MMKNRFTTIGNHGQLEDLVVALWMYGSDGVVKQMEKNGMAHFSGMAGDIGGMMGE